MQQKTKKTKIKIIDRIASERKIEPKFEQKSSRNVKFAQVLIDSPETRKKHHSASILKKRVNSFENNTNKRSDSANSMASQGPFDDQSCENSNLNKYVKEQYSNHLTLAKKKDKYTDSLFPPVISSLFSYAGRKKNKYPNVKWMRVSQIFNKKELSIFDPQGSKVMIRPSTNLSSEYFSLALNIIKNNKSLLKKMFEDQVPNPQGIYYIKIFQTNVWKYIFVDDNIPVLQSEQNNVKIRPVFITCDETPQNSKMQIWPFLLEKAYAKYYSSYQSLQSGNIFDFLEELTNKTCQQYPLESTKLEVIKELIATPNIICFGQNKQLTKIPIEIFQNSGKLSFPTSTKQKTTINISQINQHFTKIYILGSKNYTYVGYCPIRQNKQSTSISIRQFTLKNSSYCNLTLNQKDKRFFQEAMKYQYRWIRLLLVLKELNGNFRWIDGRYDNQKSLTLQGQYEAGEYYLILMPQWAERSHELNLIIRSKVPIRLQRKIYEDGIIQEACADLAQRYGRLNQLNTYICSYNCIHEDMGLIIENINNERVKGQIKILRSIDGLQSTVQIEAVNKQFQKSRSIEVIIKHSSHFTVVLKMKGGIDRHFFQTFDFGGR